MSRTPSFVTKAFVGKFMSMAGQLLLMLVLATVVALLLDLWRAKQLKADILPNVTYAALDGSEVNLASFSSSFSVLYVWASWCGPCKVTTPAIGRLSRNYPVVSVALRSGQDQTVLQEVSDHLKTTTMLNDPEGELASSLGINVTPSVVFMKDGKVIGYTSGISTYWGLWLRAKWLEFSAT